MAEVTVLLSVYNGLPYLPEAVESVRKQTFQDWRLLLINDGSTDGSGDYLDALDDPRIQVVHQENRGLAAALNAGLQLCQTPYLARLDADDMALPERLAVQWAYLERHTEIGMLGSQFAYLGTDRVARPSTLPLEHDLMVGNLIGGRHAICHATIMCRTSLLKQIGGYWEQGIAEDWDMYLRMSEVTRLANLPDSLVQVRVHDTSINGSQAGELRRRIAYACDRWQRRRDDLPSRDYEQFTRLLDQRSFWQRLGDQMDAYAMGQYRRGLAQSLGPRPFAGYARLAWAATCSPRLTAQRITRTVRGRFRGRSETPARNAALSTCLKKGSDPLADR